MLAWIGLLIHLIRAIDPPLSRTGHNLDEKQKRWIDSTILFLIYRAFSQELIDKQILSIAREFKYTNIES